MRCHIDCGYGLGAQRVAGNRRTSWFEQEDVSSFAQAIPIGRRLLRLEASVLGANVAVLVSAFRQGVHGAGKQLDRHHKALSIPLATSSPAICSLIAP